MDSDSVLVTAQACQEALEAGVERDWTRTIPGMEWTVSQAVEHVCVGLLWYAADLAAGRRELSTMDLKLRPETPAADLVATLGCFATVLARVVAGAPAGSRGFHPDGFADASGFAAMGCDEMLVHTFDACLGLDVPFNPPAAPAETTLRRLFPWAPTGIDPFHTLLWANGRLDLPGHERQTGWRWHCAPLDDWDGINPRDQRTDVQATIS